MIIVILIMILTIIASGGSSGRGCFNAFLRLRKRTNKKSQCQQEKAIAFYKQMMVKYFQFYSSQTMDPLSVAAIKKDVTIFNVGLVLQLL